MFTRRRLYFCGIWLCLGVWLGQVLLAQPEGEKKDAAAPAAPMEEKKAEAPAAEAPAPVAEAPKLPAYMTYDNSEKKWPDPIGGNAGYWATPSAGPVGDGDPEALTKTQLYDRIVHNTFSINMVWVLIAGFLVMFMQTGFAMVETGLCRAKNSAHTVAMNFMIYPLGCIAFFAYGFAIGWGNWFNAPVPPGWVSAYGPGVVVLDSGIGIDPVLDDKGAPKPGLFKWELMGNKGFFLNGMDDVSVMALFFFMMVFMDTTATIPTGTMCERWAWKNFILYGLWVALPYCLFANWIWGGGWLAQLGVNWQWGHGTVDFAGSGVVHAMGGVIGLVGCIIIGPRVGKFKEGKPQPIPGHHVPMVIFGTFILAFGWFGFNAGSAVAGTDLRIATVVVNTMLAGITAAISTYAYLAITGMKPDPTMLCNGMLAGLVAVTAPCAFIDAWAAVTIGAIAGVLVVVSVFFWEKMGVDDPCGAISVHGVCGTFGLLCVGIFANGKYGLGFNGVERGAWDEATKAFGADNPALLEDGVRGLLYGDFGQFKAQLAAAITVWVFGGVMAFVWFKLSNLITPIRVSKDVEVQGCDGPEMGTIGYPDFVVNK
jgi:Amt family ammonium transporter